MLHSLRRNRRHLSGVSNLCFCVRFMLRSLLSNLWHLRCVPRFIFVSFVLRALLDHALAIQHPLFATGKCLACRTCWLWQILALRWHCMHVCVCIRCDDQCFCIVKYLFEFAHRCRIVLVSYCVQRYVVLFRVFVAHAGC